MTRTKKIILLSFFCASNAFAQSVIVGFTGADISAKNIAEQAIDDSKNNLKVSAYQLTNQDLIERILSAKQRGVEVEVLLDRTQASGVAQKIFFEKGINCYIDKKHKIMHHKFLIVDDMHVQTGSFNYTKNAETRNAENAIYLKNEPNLANQYNQEFGRIKKTAINCAG